MTVYECNRLAMLRDDSVSLKRIVDTCASLVTGEVCRLNGQGAVRRGDCSAIALGCNTVILSEIAMLNASGCTPVDVDCRAISLCVVMFKFAIVDVNVCILMDVLRYTRA